MKSRHILIPALAASATAAWKYPEYYQPAQGFGLGANNSTDPELYNALQNNATFVAVADAFFHLGAGDFVVRTNITKVDLPGLETNFTKPRITHTEYQLSWTGNSTLREALGDFYQQYDPQIGYSVTIEPLSAEVENKVDVHDSGKCWGVLSDDCVSAIQRQQFPADTKTWSWKEPDECTELKGKFGGTLTQSVRSNITGPSQPFDMAFWSSEVYEAVPFNEPTKNPNDMYAEPELREMQRLHVMVVAKSGGSVVPICMRAGGGDLKAGDPGAAASGAQLWTPKPFAAVVISVLAAWFML